MQYSIQETDGNTYGPVDLMTLKQWAQEGRVLPTSAVTDHLSNRTLLANQMPELGLSAMGNPYSNIPSPPAPYGDYPRGQYQQQASNKTQLWAIIAWVCVAFVISMFSRNGGLITSGLCIVDAFRAKSNDDKYVGWCFGVAIGGFCLVLLWTIIKAQVLN